MKRLQIYGYPKGPTFLFILLKTLEISFNGDLIALNYKRKGLSTDTLY